MNGPQLNDPEMLAKIFFPDRPECVEFLPQSTERPIFDAAIAFGKKPVLTGFHCLSFGFINNPDGTVRWLYPMGSREARFLRLYSGAGLRSKVLKTGFRTTFAIGLETWARSGALHVFYKNEKPLGGLLDRFSLDKMAIFTGTRGENQKAVILLEDEKGKSWFCKLPLTDAAQDLVRNEQKTLTALANLNLQKMAIPISSPTIGLGLMVSDVKPSKAVSSSELQMIHYEAIAEMSRLSLQRQPLSETTFWQEINTYIESLANHPIHPDFHLETTQRVISNLMAFRDKLDATLVVPTTLAHGDFTPWNMYLSQDKLHVFDWELSERMPLLYDAFHFVFQTGVLVKRAPYDAIYATVFSIQKQKMVESLLVGQSASFTFLYQLYLLRNISYYLLKYLRQDVLHVQAYWQLAAWDAALRQY